MRLTGILLSLAFITGCSNEPEIRLNEYQSLSRFEAVFSEATPKDFAKEITEALSKYPKNSTYHYVKEDESGAWEYGVLVLSESNKILFQKKICSEI